MPVCRAGVKLLINLRGWIREILWMRLNSLYMAELCVQCQQYGACSYQDYAAPEPAVCAFKVRTGAQLKDFMQRKEVTDLQIYYNRPFPLGEPNHRPAVLATLFH